MRQGPALHNTSLVLPSGDKATVGMGRIGRARQDLDSARVTGNMQIAGMTRMRFCSRDWNETCAIGGPSHFVPSVTNQSKAAMSVG